MKGRLCNSVFIILSVSIISSAPIAGRDNILNLDFSSGEIDWATLWQTGSMTSEPSSGDYKDYYRVDRLKGGYLITDHCSYYSDTPCNYLQMQMDQIIKPYSQHGFWNPDSNNWVGSLLWNEENGWQGHYRHDWKYSIELQEGALIAAMTLPIFELNPYMAQELEYIHKYIKSNGQVAEMEFNRAQYEYGLVLSVLGLGAVYFDGLIGTPASVARNAYMDLNKVFKYIAANENIDKPNLNLPIVLRGVVHAYNAFSYYSKPQLMEASGTLARDLSVIIVNSQKSEGYYDFGYSELPVQNQLKASIALMMMYSNCRIDELYLEAVRKNLAWVIDNRWDHMEKNMGGLIWSEEDPESFYECHQMWFLIAAKYCEMNTQAEYTSCKNKAMGFLTDDNFAGVDMYVDNWNKYGAFFSYRAISRDGSIQKEAFHRFKGAYEIGASLWAMALNYNLYSEGYSNLITQTPMDSARTACDWNSAIFLKQELHTDRYGMTWDMMFYSLEEGGAMAGLYRDYSGDFLIQLDSDEGLRYRSKDGVSRLLFPREGMNPGAWYTVSFIYEYANLVTVTLSSGGEILFSAVLDDVSPVCNLSFGVLQWKSLPGHKNNIYIDNISWRDMSDDRPDAQICRTWPNPFNSQVKIMVNLDKLTPCNLAFYDVSGKIVKRLLDSPYGPGKYIFTWDGLSDRGDPVNSGIYFLRISTDDGSIARKVILLK